MTATNHTNFSVSLLTLTVRCINIAANRLCGSYNDSMVWVDEEAYIKEAFEVAAEKYDFVYGEFMAVVKEGMEAGLIVEGCFENTIKTVRCECGECDESASYVVEEEDETVNVCNVCKEIIEDVL